jgi:asparagine synthase (glutamine-hydrolysing)
LLSESDSEVILHLYEELGPACVSRLRGMFAFAIWDERQARIFCARDRVGKKPLYYRKDGTRLWFASEARAILADPLVSRSVNTAAVRSYLSLGYVPAPQSAFVGLERLRPAHSMMADRRGVTDTRYWQLAYTPKLNIAEQAAIDGLLARLKESVRQRLISDVPLGAFLSGGLDSSTIVALMSQEKAHVKTFAIGFEEAEYNELQYARIVAKQFDTDHHELIVRPDATALLPKIAWHYGEPYADSSAVPTFYLAQFARQHITVALNGDGGDENFGGYTRHVVNRTAVAYQRLPWAVRRAAGSRLGFCRAEPRQRD